MKLQESAHETCKWVSLIRLCGECCKNNSCIPTIRRVYRPRHCKITLLESCSATVSNFSVAQTLTSLPLWCLRTKHSSQEIDSRIFTVSIWELMKNHMRFFQHITNSGSPSTSVPVFVGIICSDLTYSQTGFQGGITKLSWKATLLISWATCHWLFVRELHFMHEVTLSSGTWIESFLVGA
jgi:hypothetical protein